jgi:hypothetical protein
VRRGNGPGRCPLRGLGIYEEEAGTGSRFGGLFGQAISQASLQSRMPTQTRIRFAIRTAFF